MNDGSLSLKMGFCNSTEVELTIWLEPWADRFHLKPQSEIVLLIETDEGIPAPPRFDISTEIVAVYAAVGTRIRVFVDGVAKESRSGVIACPGWDTDNYARLHGLNHGRHPDERSD